ncbi:MAG TPA: ATP-binding protein [Thermomicrobiales bacterium]|nr:ATP-binding protein [Thermomicrobiales bacterium]
MFRPTVRLRLTILFGVLFFAVGLVMIVLIYGSLRQQLEPPERGGPGPFGGSPGQQSDLDRDTVEGRIFEVRKEERRFALGRVARTAIVVLLLATVAVFVMGWLISGRMLRPIRQITRHARHASETTLSERIGLRGPPDELKELADTIDAMLGRLEAAFRSQREFAAQASHELRTPLSIIQAEADLALAAPDGSADQRILAGRVRDAALRSERLVDGLLTLSRSESSMRDSVPLDLADLAGDVAGETIDEADRAGIRMDLELETVTVAGDRVLLGQLISNLLQNAIRYNQPGGWVRLAVSDMAAHNADENPFGRIRVENSGPVVPAGELEGLFQSFRRGTGSAQRANGFGLGLAIVRSVAEAHGGRVEAAPRQDGGLVVDVLLPMRRAIDEGRAAG